MIEKNAGETNLIATWTWPEVLVGEIKLLDAEGTVIMSVASMRRGHHQPTQGGVLLLLFGDGGGEAAREAAWAGVSVCR